MIIATCECLLQHVNADVTLTSPHVHILCVTCKRALHLWHAKEPYIFLQKSPIFVPWSHDLHFLFVTCLAHMCAGTPLYLWHAKEPYIFLQKSPIFVPWSHDLHFHLVTCFAHVCAGTLSYYWNALHVTNIHAWWDSPISDMPCAHVWWLNDSVSHWVMEFVKSGLGKRSHHTRVPSHMCARHVTNRCERVVCFICAPWPFQKCHMTRLVRHVCVRLDSVVCVTWLLHMCDMTCFAYSNS